MQSEVITNLITNRENLGLKNEKGSSEVCERERETKISTELRGSLVAGSLVAGISGEVWRAFVSMQPFSCVSTKQQILNPIRTSRLSNPISTSSLSGHAETAPHAPRRAPFLPAQAIF